jgi:hypothetical protein
MGFSTGEGDFMQQLQPQQVSALPHGAEFVLALQQGRDAGSGVAASFAISAATSVEVLQQQVKAATGKAARRVEAAVSQTTSA